MERNTRWFVLLAVVMIAGTLIGCGSRAANPVATETALQLPHFLDNAPAEFREAYHFAVSHPHDLETVPCYCGCGSPGLGHTSNLDCYIQEVNTDGTIIFDEHASVCGICVDITQDVIRLKDEGRSPIEIRTYIDDTYSKFAPGTDTPLPAA